MSAHALHLHQPLDPHSVSVYNGYAALSLDGVPSTAPGILRIYNLYSGRRSPPCMVGCCSLVAVCVCALCDLEPKASFMTQLATLPSSSCRFLTTPGAKVGETVLAGCAMPDSVAWTRDGGRIVVACEGEPATQVRVRAHVQQSRRACRCMCSAASFRS